MNPAPPAMEDPPMSSESALDGLVTHQGGCHCGRVRYRVDAPARIQVFECNCSICSKSGYLHLLVERGQFELLSGADALSEYRFDSGEAIHLFCRHCGVKSFYVPRSNPNGFSVNVRCLDPGTVTAMDLEPFDGRNWEQSIAELRAKTGR